MSRHEKDGDCKKMKIELESTDIDRLAQEITIRVTENLKSCIVNAASAEDVIFTVDTLATYLQTTPKWVYNHLAELPHFKVDGLLRFRRRMIEKYFEHNPLKHPKTR
jgi:hypothetical protein